MNAQKSTSKNTLISLVFNSIGIISILIIVVGVLIGILISPNSTNWLFTMTRWIYDSYIFIITFGLLAIIGFVVSGIFEYRKDGNKSKLFSHIGKITAMLALLTLPTAPLVGQLFCTKTITGTGCNLASIGLIVYFIFGAIVLSVISIILFTLSTDFKRTESSKIIH